MTFSNDNVRALKNRADLMPSELRTVLTIDLETFVEKVQNDFDLSASDAAALENEIALTLLAFEPYADLALNIKSQTSVSDKVASHIAEKVGGDLLGKNLDTLIEINVQQLGEENAAKSQESTPPVKTESMTAPKQPTQSVPTPTQDQQKQAEVEKEEPIVQPLRTMEGDMDKIHGYGSYRKMYPDPEAKSAIPDVEAKEAGLPDFPNEEPTVKATSQDEVLEKRPQLAELPAYDDNAKNSE